MLRAGHGETDQRNLLDGLPSCNPWEQRPANRMHLTVASSLTPIPVEQTIAHSRDAFHHPLPTWPRATAVSSKLLKPAK